MIINAPGMLLRGGGDVLRFARKWGGTHLAAEGRRFGIPPLLDVYGTYPKWSKQGVGEKEELQ